MYFKQDLMLILLEREDGKEQHGEGEEFELTEIKDTGQEIRFGKGKGNFAHSSQN